MFLSRQVWLHRACHRFWRSSSPSFFPYPHHVQPRPLALYSSFGWHIASYYNTIQVSLEISELGIRGNALTQIQIQFDMSETCVTPYMYLKYYLRKKRKT